jgi:hypothetical protein
LKSEREKGKTKMSEPGILQEPLTTYQPCYSAVSKELKKKSIC